MGLIKSPNVLTFFIAIALVAIGVLAKLGVAVPLVSGSEFWALLAANVLFILGCITRGF